MDSSAGSQLIGPFINSSRICFSTVCSGADDKKISLSSLHSSMEDTVFAAARVPRYASMESGLLIYGLSLSIYFLSFSKQRDSRAAHLRGAGALVFRKETTKCPNSVICSSPIFVMRKEQSVCFFGLSILLMLFCNVLPRHSFTAQLAVLRTPGSVCRAARRINSRITAPLCAPFNAVMSSLITLASVSRFKAFRKKALGDVPPQRLILCTTICLTAGSGDFIKGRRRFHFLKADNRPKAVIASNLRNPC